jgi:hypothetical protein
MTQAVVRVKYIRLFRVPGPSVPHAIMSEPGSGLKLSLERLYKDELGRIIPTYTISRQMAIYVFEPCASMFFMRPEVCSSQQLWIAMNNPAHVLERT